MATAARTGGVPRASRRWPCSCAETPRGWSLGRRLRPPAGAQSDGNGRARRGRPTRVAPLTLFLREDAAWLLDGPQPASDASLSHPAREVLAELQQRGASFFP